MLRKNIQTTKSSANCADSPTRSNKKKLLKSKSRTNAFTCRLMRPSSSNTNAAKTARRKWKLKLNGRRNSRKKRKRSKLINHFFAFCAKVLTFLKNSLLVAVAIRFVQINRIGFRLSQAQIQNLDDDRKRHGEIYVAFRDFLVKAFGDEHHAD